MIMTRPPGERFAQIPIGRTGHTVDVIRAPGLWALTYRGEFVNLCKKSLYVSTIKYTRTTWTNEATAHSQAAKYNAWDKSQDFGVIQLL
jgi:hypothetical protein